jgi:hypothetical protein
MYVIVSLVFQPAIQAAYAIYFNIHYSCLFLIHPSTGWNAITRAYCSTQRNHNSEFCLVSQFSWLSISSLAVLQINATHPTDLAISSSSSARVYIYIGRVKSGYNSKWVTTNAVCDANDSQSAWNEATRSVLDSSLCCAADHQLEWSYCIDLIDWFFIQAGDHIQSIYWTFSGNCFDRNQNSMDSGFSPSWDSE